MFGAPMSRRPTPAERPRRHVVATAGHVDHGKSTLVRRLTGLDPDRWAEEKRRGLTIDLGFVWTTLPSGDRVEFVDVPGHERFIGNMLAGLGPVSVALLVVAADEGIKQQTLDHRDAIDAFGIRRGLVVLSRVDLADRLDMGRRAAAREEIRDAVRGTTLEGWPIAEVSAVTGEGIDGLVDMLARLLSAAPDADPGARLRLWVDRSFSVSGAGTVMTGTLAAGRVSAGDRLELAGHGGRRLVTVRGLQTEGHDVSRLGPPARCAANLRGVGADAVHRGDALLTPGAWGEITAIDIEVRGPAGGARPRLPRELAVHVGTAEVQAAVRPLGGRYARLTLSRGLPLEYGDRLVLRAPGGHTILAGARVLDTVPPELARRGAAARRAGELDEVSRDPAGALLRRKGAVSRGEFRRRGLAEAAEPLARRDGVLVADEWIVAAAELDRWVRRATALVDAAPALNPVVPKKQLTDILPDPRLVPFVLSAAGLVSDDRGIRRPGERIRLGAAEPAVAALEHDLRADPFTAPTAARLRELGLGARELAAAERAGRLLRIAEGIILLPDAPERAGELLAASASRAFTVAEAKRILGTTRRVAVPLLELLDDRGITTRIDASLRRLTGR